MRILLNEHEIAQRVAELGQQITRDFASTNLLVVGVLHGSVVLVADLIRQIRTPHQIAFVRASSYRGHTTTHGELVTALTDLPEIQGRHVLLVDDIFDTGRTVERLTQELREQQPASLKTAVLLWKRDRQQVSISPDYAAFQIPDEFVVGYGLDYNGDYRYLPYIAVLEPSDITPR